MPKSEQATCLVNPPPPQSEPPVHFFILFFWKPSLTHYLSFLFLSRKFMNFTTNLFKFYSKSSTLIALPCYVGID